MLSFERIFFEMRLGRVRRKATLAHQTFFNTIWHDNGMSITPDHPPKLAVLIDAENAPARIAAGLFIEIAVIGEASVRRIYGDFSGSRLKRWVEVSATHAILPHQNFANISGKNASDIALVIDAMDLLHSGRCAIAGRDAPRHFLRGPPG